MKGRGFEKSYILVKAVEMRSRGEKPWKKAVELMK